MEHVGVNAASGEFGGRMTYPVMMRTVVLTSHPSARNWHSTVDSRSDFKLVYWRLCALATRCRGLGPSLAVSSQTLSLSKQKLNSFTVDLRGVEFKSLPSGLHNVKEDLVYFNQDRNYAGLSAFRNDTASSAHRNASFACVGALVPLNGSRLGRIWLHAPELRRLAATTDDSAEHTSQLESYWEDYQALDPDSQEQPLPGASPRKKGRANRTRALSESTNLGSVLPFSFHPARSAPDLLDDLGPLLFPLYRAALLRKRILLIKKAPVRLSCDFVYLLSIISSIPNDVIDTITMESSTRSTSKFSVGITEIPELEQAPRSRDKQAHADPDGNSTTDEVGIENGDGGWIACTTDELLSMKTQLYDTKVEFPGIGSKKAQHQLERIWPKISEPARLTSPAQSQSSSATLLEHMTVRASPRDARRYKALRHGLRRLTGSWTFTDNPDNIGRDYEDEEQDLLLQPESDRTGNEEHGAGHNDVDEPIPAEREAVESPPWAAIAYDSFVWWASAGERSIEADDEELHYRELLSSTAGNMDYMRPGRRGSSGSVFGSQPGGAEDNGLAAALVGYFHRWTALMLSTLADMVEEVESSTPADESDLDGVKIIVRREDLARIGLDSWSVGDREFVKELCKLYFSADASVEGRSVECCGVKFPSICEYAGVGVHLSATTFLLLSIRFDLALPTRLAQCEYVGCEGSNTNAQIKWGKVVMEARTFTPQPKKKKPRRYPKLQHVPASTQAENIYQQSATQPDTGKAKTIARDDEGWSVVTRSPNHPAQSGKRQGFHDGRSDENPLEQLRSAVGDAGRGLLHGALLDALCTLLALKDSSGHPGLFVSASTLDTRFGEGAPITAVRLLVDSYYAIASMGKRPPEDDIVQLRKRHEKISIMWKGSRGREPLLNLVTTHLPSIRNHAMFICLGLGSLSAEVSGWKAVSMWQLVIWEDICATITNKERHLVFQDPLFTTTDKIFIAALGYEVSDSPHAYGRISEGSIVYTPHFPQRLWPQAARMGKPALIIGNRVSEVANALAKVPERKVVGRAVSLLEALADTGDEDAKHEVSLLQQDVWAREELEMFLQSWRQVSVSGLGPEECRECLWETVIWHAAQDLDQDEKA
ncbi:hypothetical protein FH972_026882 [Carpinus fangiana]|uniref:SRR1-like domain-containing protein n=1 Tax=Carpinus fangiana TaxID=176857 RepID=A0A5N6L7T3_9ROSI|nr:hypothetical protein FH972_026882 [Carpinus fangiana]